MPTDEQVSLYAKKPLKRHSICAYVMSRFDSTSIGYEAFGQYMRIHVQSLEVLRGVVVKESL
jgi:hypothetical protein